MSVPANISKSVARAFRVLELFRELRKPMTAAQIQHAIDIPQPSVRVLLREMTNIGYLACTMPGRTYFPTPRLCTLGDWLGSSLVVHQPLIRAVDNLARASGETASLSTATYGHVEVLHARKADHALALQVMAGMGGSLWRGAVGRTLLSLRSEPEVAAFLNALQPRDATRGRRQREQVIAQVRLIRNQGYFIGYDVLLKGVGAICVPVPAALSTVPLVLAVAGGKDRIQPRERIILRAIRSELREIRPRRVSS